MQLPRASDAWGARREVDRRRIASLQDLALTRASIVLVVALLLAWLVRGVAPPVALTAWTGAAVVASAVCWATLRAPRADPPPSPQVLEWRHVVASGAMGLVLASWWVAFAPLGSSVEIAVALLACTSVMVGSALLPAASPLAFGVCWVPGMATVLARLHAGGWGALVGPGLLHCAVVLAVHLRLHLRLVSSIREQMEHEDEVVRDLTVLDVVADAVVVCVGTRVSDANDRFALLVGRSRPDLRGDDLAALVRPTEPGISLDSAPVGARVLAQVLGAAGEPRILEMRVGPPSGWNRQQLWSCRDITDRVARERALAHLADHDELTGVLNRRGVRRWLDARPDGDVVAAVMVDVDGLKDVNGRFGHPVGDRLLSVLAERLRRVVGTDGVVARAGGDEFVLVVGLTDADLAPAVRLADQAVILGARDYDLGLDVVRLSVSVGVARSEPGQRALTPLLAAASRAVSAAQSAGGGRWCSDPTLAGTALLGPTDRDGARR